MEPGESGPDAMVSTESEADVIDRIPVWDELIRLRVDSAIAISGGEVDEYWSAAGDVNARQGDVMGSESPRSKRKRWMQPKG
ncbi:MAG TPA: hypothetical protein VFO16_10125, partial [Pseudonocardiaceae bacterium]|nr:hypothetical protein [Pseudonocardiaceae bacterium]